MLYCTLLMSVIRWNEAEIGFNSLTKTQKCGM
jgi:hypothetical protein